MNGTCDGGESCASSALQACSPRRSAIACSGTSAASCRRVFGAARQSFVSARSRTSRSASRTHTGCGWWRVRTATSPKSPTSSVAFVTFRSPSLIAAQTSDTGVFLRPNQLTRPIRLSPLASARACQALDENCRLNGRRFRVIHAAVAATSGTVAWFSTGNDQASASLYDVTGPVRLREQVTTLALDDLGITGIALIKLDVEGAEVEAFRGAWKLLEGDTLLCYEDHGADPTCAPTRLALDHGLSVFWSTPNGRIREIHDVERVRAIKTRRSYGYNFFACRPGSPFVHRLGHRSER